MIHSNERPKIGESLGKFESSDLNKRFWQMFTNMKIRKQKLDDLKNLKCCSES